MPEALRGMRVIDAHHHFWRLGQFPYPWLAPDAGSARFGDKAPIRRDYLPPDYLSDLSCVDLVGSVHVQANSGAADPVAETKWLEQLAQKTGWPHAIVAEVDLTKASASALIARHAAASPRLRGVRTPVAWDAAGRWRIANHAAVLTDPIFLSSVQTLIAHDLALDIVVVPEQLPQVADLAGAFPGLRITINHFSTLEPAQTGNADAWYEGICSIAAHPNIYLKISGLWTVDLGWAPEVLEPFIAHALTYVTPSRMMYGSNQPVEGVNCRPSQQLKNLTQVLADVPHEAIHSIFHDTAKSVYWL